MRPQHSIVESVAAARLAHAYRDALLAGDGRRAEQTVRDLLLLGSDPAEIYLDVFAPALEAIGTLWQQDALSVAEEHLATAITERMMGLVRPLFQPTAASSGYGEERRTPVLLLACVRGEQHRVGSQMVADIFLRAGWDVLHLGADVPTGDLVRLAATRRPDLIAFSVTIDRHLAALRDAIQRLQDAPATRHIPIMVGGAPFFENPLLGDDVGADLVATTPQEALALANALLEGEESGENAATFSSDERFVLEHKLQSDPSYTTNGNGSHSNGSGANGKAPGRRGGSGPVGAPWTPPDQEDAAALVSPAIVFVLDREGRIRWANEAGLVLAGNDAAPAIGRNFASLTDNYSREKIMRLLARTAGGESVVDFEINHVVPHHNAPIVLVSYSAFALPDGTVNLVGRDLAHRLDAVAALAERNQRLEGALSALTEERSRLEAQAAEFADVHRRLERQWQRERRLAVALQKSFLGSAPSALPGLDVAYRYRPASTDANVGGDFYDVSPVGTDHVAIVIADVSGKGLRAALATVMVKYTLRAYAAEDPAPSSVLRRFNRFACEHGDVDGFITVFYGLLNLRTGDLVWGSAGHEPPLLVRPGAGASAIVELLEETSLVAGALPETMYSDNRTRLLPGDLLVAYTDGIIDARHRSAVDGIANEREGELLGLVEIEGFLDAFCGSPAAVAATAEQIVEGLYGRVWALCGGRLTDDATLLVVRRSA